MERGVLLLAAGGLAREVIATGAVEGVVGMLDDDPARHGTRVGGVEVLGAIADAAWRRERLLVCAGQGVARRAIVSRLTGLGVPSTRYATAVHPRAVLAPGTEVGHGSIVLPGVVATAGVRIGEHVVIMPNSVLTHDDELSDYATLAAGVALGGTVKVGEAAYLGMNSAVRQGLRIGAHATIGMGAAVLSHVPDDEIWAGVPARRLVEKGLR